MIPVLNRHRDEIPEGAIYIGRPSKWGNPYSHLWNTIAQFKTATREESIERYRKHLAAHLQADPKYLDPLREATALVCFCAPRACHGDVIAKELYEDQRASDV